MEGISFLFLFLLVLTGLALLINLVTGLTAQGESGSLKPTFIGLGVLWVLFYSLTSLGHIDEEDVAGTYVASTQAGVSGGGIQPGCQLVLTEGKLYRFTGNCATDLRCEHGRFEVKTVADEYHQVSLYCNSVVKQGVFSQSATAATINFDTADRDADKASIYFFERRK